MAVNKKKSGKGFFNTLLLILAVCIPFFSAAFYLDKVNQDQIQRVLMTEKARVIFEMNRFSDALDPARYIEKCMSLTEEKLALRSGLISETDPRLFDRQTSTKIKSFIWKNFQLKPVLIASTGFAGRDFWAEFSDDFQSFAADDLQVLKNTLCSYLILKVMQRNLYQNSEIYERLQKLMIDGENVFEINREKIDGILSDFLAPAIHYPEYPGNCEEIFTTRFSSDKIFLYYSGSSAGNLFYGGYFIVFATRDLPYQKILSDALKSSGGIKRAIVNHGGELNELLVEDSADIDCYREIPGYVNLSKLKFKQNFEKSVFYLKTSCSKSLVLEDLKWFNANLGFMQRMVILFISGILVFSYLFGIHAPGKLRGKFLFLVGLSVMLPYAITGYFSGLTLDYVDGMRERESLVAAENRLFEISRSVEDCSLKRQLIVLEAKKRIADLLSAWQNKPSDPLDPASYPGLIPQSLSDEFTVFDAAGDVRVFHKNPDRFREPYKLVRFLGYTYLDNMGVLKRKSGKVKRELELAGLASGFASNLRRDYLEGRNLRFEGVEIMNLAKFNPLLRMFFLVFSPKMPKGSPINAIALVILNDRFLTQLFEILSVPGNRLFSEQSKGLSLTYVLGMRNHENSLEKWWPNNDRNSEKLIDLLKFATLRGYSGSEVQKIGQIFSGRIWQYDADSKYVIAGIFSSEPDNLLRLLFYLFPSAALVFSFISLLFLGDFLVEFFARPVTAFIPALKEIKEGNYQVRINMDAGDELDLLSSSFNQMAEGLQQRERMRRFIPGQLFQRVEDSGAADKRSLQRRHLSLLASDIRGFTTLSEKEKPEDMVNCLNDYFSAMEEAVVANGGEIERFIGDAIIAVFYPDKNLSSAFKALKAALKMKECLETFNRQRKEKGLFQILNGVGIVTDYAWVATTGIRSGRRVHMVFGEIVARANRLEALTANLVGSRIALCENTRNANPQVAFKKIDTDQAVFQPEIDGVAHGS
ncbi:MAG: adenylate/guanylate cyclase domain-containing protein [Candidatus Rifleibacteriota bacterium]